MKQNQAGYSLMEVLVAISISTLAVYFVATAFNDVYRDSAKVVEDAGKRTDIVTMNAAVQRTLLRSDIRLYGFAAAATGMPLGRFLLPRLDLCADGKSHCGGLLSLLWASYDNKLPTFPAICALDEKKVVVDLSITDLGELSLSGAGIAVESSSDQYPSGKVSLKSGDLIALIDEPVGVIFKVGGSISSFDPGYDSDTKTYSNATFAANEDCVKNTNDPKKLYVFEVSPFYIPKTGSATPTATAIRGSMGGFPLRVSPVRIWNLGLQSESVPTGLSLRGCDADLRCDREIVSVHNIHSFHLQETLSIGFQGQSHLISIAINSSRYCQPGSCLVLPVPAPVPIAAAKEKEEYLYTDSFSILKQDYVNTISFFVEVPLEKSSQKEVKLEVFHATSF